MLFLKLTFLLMNATTLNVVVDPFMEMSYWVVLPNRMQVCLCLRFPEQRKRHELVQTGFLCVAVWLLVVVAFATAVLVTEPDAHPPTNWFCFVRAELCCLTFPLWLQLWLGKWMSLVSQLRPDKACCGSRTAESLFVTGNPLQEDPSLHPGQEKTTAGSSKSKLLPLAHRRQEKPKSH